MRSFIGYHGTTALAAQSIVRTQSFVVTDNPDHWLGVGVYFFEDDIEQAVNWCTKARKFPKWAVIRSSISADKVVDLLMLSDVEEFQRIARTLVSRYSKLNAGERPKLMNADVLSVIYRVSGYDLVRSAFRIPKTYPIQYTNVVPLQIQLCVRNQACIKTIEEVHP